MRQQGIMLDSASVSGSTVRCVERSRYEKCIGTASRSASKNTTALRNMYGNARALVIGLDGAEWSVDSTLRQNDGLLPNLSRLIRDGAHGLNSTTPPMTLPFLVQYADGLSWYSTVSSTLSTEIRQPKTGG